MAQPLKKKKKIASQFTGFSLELSSSFANFNDDSIWKCSKLSSTFISLFLIQNRILIYIQTILHQGTTTLRFLFNNLLRFRFSLNLRWFLRFVDLGFGVCLVYRLRRLRTRWRSQLLTEQEISPNRFFFGQCSVREKWVVEFGFGGRFCFRRRFIGFSRFGCCCTFIFGG